jgi:glycosyltransferase involved in cell wall biosynthesis
MVVTGARSSSGFDPAGIRVALVHDWLTGMRGGEKVLLELCRLFPRSRVYTLFWNRGSVHQEIEQRVAQVSFLAKLPTALGYRYYLPLFPAAVRSLKIEQADLVISSSHAAAKGVRVPPGVPHLSYIHTPARYLWDETGSYFAFGKGLRWKRPALSLVTPYLRRFDVRSTQPINLLAANSDNVRRRIKQVYGRDAQVIYPPVDVNYFNPDPEVATEDFYLVVSALEPYKRIELALEGFRHLDRQLIVAGSGTQDRDLRAIAPGNVHFAGRVSDEELRSLYRRCRGLVFPGIEDFGMTLVEAQACGRPVICYAAGGALESVMDGTTGIHFQPQTAEALAAAILRFEQTAWDPNICRRNSLRFSADVFRRDVLDAAGELVDDV